MLFTRMQGGESSLLSNLFRLKKEKNKEGKDKECWIIRLDFFFEITNIVFVIVVSCAIWWQDVIWWRRAKRPIQ